MNATGSQQTKIGFEFDAEKYRMASSHQKDWGRAVIDSLNLAGHERIIDLGCGDGVLAAELARRVPAGYVLGIDASANMIRLASSLVRENLEFVQIDIMAMDFVEDFNIAFSNATLHWIKDHRRLLKRVRRSLQPGGVARFNFAARGTGKAFDDAACEVMAQARFAPSFAGFDWPWYMPDVDEYRQLVFQAGFTEAEVWGENRDRYFDDAEQMIRWIDQPCLVPFMEVLSEADKADFRRQVIDGVLRRTAQSGGSCFMTFRRINVTTRK